MQVKHPILTDTYESVSLFEPVTDSAYIYAKSSEDRSSHVDNWLKNGIHVCDVEIPTFNNHSAEFKFRNNVANVALRNSNSFLNIWKEINSQSYYLDITGLPHHVWAPCLKSLLSLKLDVMTVYVEPEKYAHSSVAPTEGQIYDLSEKIMGISPLPGFISLAEPRGDSFVFVPLLGFEGARFAYVVEQVQPRYEKTVPIIGVPGFKPGFPFETYISNKRILDETESWKNAKYVPANCPFSLFNLLHDIATNYTGHYIKLAPIGTKPHALGAILYKIAEDRMVEVVYDHPIRKLGRTSGTDRLHVYHVSALFG